MRGRQNIKLSKPPTKQAKPDKNPYNIYKPGFFIPVYKVHSKAEREKKEDNDHLEVTNHVDRISHRKQASFKFGTELALSECSYKVINRNHNCNRMLHTRLTHIDKDVHKFRRENEVDTLLLHSEHTILTKRKTKDLNELRIPEWRYTDICKCHVSKRDCPRHWREHEKAKLMQRKDHNMFGLKTESEENIYESYPVTRIASPRMKKPRQYLAKPLLYLD